MRRNKRKKHIATEDAIRRRIVLLFALVIIFFAGLGFRIGWIQVIATDTYASKAAETQVKDEIIPPKRGNILDRNGKELAFSTISYRIWLRLKPYNDKIKTDPTEQKRQLEQATELLSESLGMKPGDISAKLDTDSTLVKVATGVNKDQMALIRQGIQKRKLNNIEVEEQESRNYPMGTLAAHVLGSLDSDGNGRGGIELQYNSYLSGISGRRIQDTDRNGNPLGSGEQLNYAQQDGLNVMLSLDETIQYYAEKATKKAYNDTKAKKVEAIVMDPKNGDILAMAAYPTFDPNSPGEPLLKEDKKEFAGLSAADQATYLNQLWRNPLISDLYDPGSTFKLVTVASAIEVSAVTPESQFKCDGHIQVSDVKIRCGAYPGAHGVETVRQAVGNSCNPVLIQIAQKMGFNRFYQYMSLFGITEPTGISFPAEASPLIQNKGHAGPVDLATMSYGQGLSITPLQMVTAVSAIGNDGKLMQPRLVKGFTTQNGDIAQEFPSKIKRQVVSAQTAEEVRDIMEYVVQSGSGQEVQIPGYRVGAKTGTTQKLINGKYSTTRIMGSMIAMAPMDDPQFTVLVIVDDPVIGSSGRLTAGPAVKEILTELLRYKNIKPNE